MMPSATHSTPGAIATRPAAAPPLVRATPPGRPQEICPGLDSQLDQLVRAADPITTARTLGLRVEEGAVQVELVLGEGDLVELARFQVRPGKQVDDRLQAFVPIRFLCEVAATDVVETVLVPSQAVPVNRP